MKVNVSWVYYALLEVGGAHLVRASGGAVHAGTVGAVILTRVVHVYVDADLVTASVLRLMTLLSRLRWLGIRLVIVVVGARPAASSRRPCSLRIHQGRLCLLN